MIEKFVTRWEENKATLERKFREKLPASYLDIVRGVIATVSDEDGCSEPNPDKIHVIDDGDWQGTILFVIPENGYQPSTYWAVSMDYGSCTVCDTLQSIVDACGSDDHGTTIIGEQTVKDLMTLALHVVQRLKQI